MNNLLEHPAVHALPAEDQLLIALYPGALFGFVDKDFKAAEDRIRCEHCKKVFAKGLRAIECLPENPGWRKRLKQLFLKVFLRKPDTFSVSGTLDQLIARATRAHPEHWDKKGHEVSKRILGVYIALEGLKKI